MGWYREELEEIIQRKQLWPWGTYWPHGLWTSLAACSPRAVHCVVERGAPSLPCCCLHRRLGQAVDLAAVLSEQTYSPVLWCSWPHIDGISEGQWRLLPGTAQPLCRRVNCRNSLLLRQEGPCEWLTWTQKCWIESYRAIYKSCDLDGVTLSALPCCITRLKNCCFLSGGSYNFPLLPASLAALRMSSGVYWSRLSFFASFLHSIFKFITLLSVL